MKADPVATVAVFLHHFQPLSPRKHSRWYD